MDNINNIEEQNTGDEQIASRPRHHTRPKPTRDKFFVLRQIFNIIFMVGAVIGCVVYIKVNDTMGAILIIIAMAFKMAECVLRFRKTDED